MHNTASHSTTTAIKQTVEDLLVDDHNLWENQLYIVNLGGSRNDGENSTDGR